jgi:hypothetical protein
MKYLLLSSLILLTGCTMPQSVQFAPLVEFNDSPVTIPLIKGETNNVPVVEN